jgi:hypothetical protein
VFLLVLLYDASRCSHSAADVDCLSRFRTVPTARFDENLTDSSISRRPSQGKNLLAGQELSWMFGEVQGMVWRDGDGDGDGEVLRS